MSLPFAVKRRIDNQHKTHPCIGCGHGSHAFIDCPNPRKLTGSLWQTSGRQLLGQVIAYLEELRGLTHSSTQATKAAEASSGPPSGLSLGSSTGQAPTPTAQQGIQIPQNNAAPDVHYQPLTKRLIAQGRRPTGDDLRRAGKSLEGDLAVPQKLEKLHTLGSGFDFPIRKTFFDAKSKVFTNHYELTIDTKKPIYEYRILGPIAGKNKRNVRAIIETAIESCAFLRNNKANFATDFSNTIVSWIDLHSLIQAANHVRLRGDGISEDSEWQLVTLQDRATTVPLTFRYEREVNVTGLKDHSNTGVNSVDLDKEPIIRALNILLSKCFDEASGTTIQTGPNKFFLMHGYADLTNGRNPPAGRTSASLCTIRGFFYTIKAGVGKILLNINSATSAFYKPVLVSDLMRDTLAFSSDELLGALKGLRVRINYERGKKDGTKEEKEAYEKLNSDKGRTKTIQSLGARVNEQEFKMTPSSPPQKVGTYWRNTYQRPLNYDRLPAVNLAQPGAEERWYVPEQLTILPYQKFKGLVPEGLTAGMLKTACLRPWDTAALIDIEGLEALGVATTQHNQQTLRHCPVLSIDPQMLKVPSHRFPFPRIQYHNRAVNVVDSKWNLKQTQFFKRDNRTVNTLVLRDSLVDNGLVSFAKDNFQSFAGGPIGNFANYGVARINYTGNVQSMNPRVRNQVDKAIKEQAHLKNELALLILKGKDPTAYANFKDLADRTYGLQSLVITDRALNGSIGEVMGNLMMKANLKMSGSNHTIDNGVIENTLKDTLVLGADVTHPGPGSLMGCPSIAAIVGSVDPWAGRFLGSMRLQSEGRKEIIDEVEPMVRERIRDWVIEQKKVQGKAVLPKNILYYRDGVSDSQYIQVKTDELPHIRKAFNSATLELIKEKVLSETDRTATVNVTAIVVAKRHHVRFYPIDEQTMDRKTQNCPSGTYVDNIVTSPYFTDFYLQSHAAIKGTAKPAHYFIVENEMSRSVDQLRQLTHELCFTYVRSTVGVSYAAPAYYADRLCERGRCYIRDFFAKTATGAKRRDSFDSWKHTEERNKRSARIVQWGAERDPQTHKKRQKSQKEVDQENAEKGKIDQEGKDWTMKEAREAFYVNGMDQNPWHPRISKTMFWM